jgi:hypothetical protein
MWAQYIVHSPNDQSPNDHSPNDQYPNDHSSNDQSSENLKCDQSPNATISRTTILRTTNLLMQPILASFSSCVGHGQYISDRDPDRQGCEALAGAGSNPDPEQMSDQGPGQRNIIREVKK